MNYISTTRCNKENLTYLKQYEGQDFWRENPTSWPIGNTAVTADFQIRRQNAALGVMQR